MHPVRSLIVALAALGTVAPAPRAQSCGDGVLLGELDAGATAVELRTPDGAPIVGTRFSVAVRVTDPALFGQVGELVWSPSQSPVALPGGVTLFPGQPQFSKAFVVGSEGKPGFSPASTTSQR